MAEETGFKDVLDAFTPTTGTVIWSRQVDIPIPSEISSAVQQRPALAVASGYVYGGFGGLDEGCAQYRGESCRSPGRGPGQR